LRRVARASRFDLSGSIGSCLCARSLSGGRNSSSACHSAVRMPEISRGRALAYLAAVLTVLTVGGRFVFDRSEPETRPARAALVAEPAPARNLIVHVVGAVRAPGLYELAEGSRIDDAIREAGGPKARAALELVNLAAPVADGQQVVVPLRSGGGPGPSEAAAPASGDKVHLNSATLADLDTLPGIGPVTAQKILDYRAAHGAFQSVDELDAVSGIGPATLAELKPLVDL
jgi:competence protein ComEA